MEIDKDTVRKIAFLSRLNVDDNIDDTKTDFQNILNLIEEFNEVDTNNVEPLVAVNDSNISLRKDEVAEGGNPSAVLANAPEQEFGYFVVPKVVD